MTSAGPMTILEDVREPLDRLLALRRTLLSERESAPTPAVARSLEMADTYLFLAITYLGYTEQQYAEEA